MSTELDVAAAEAEIVDPATTPAITLGCDRCGTSTLLRPGGFCADCIAAIGLSDDQAEYAAWRRRVTDDVAAGPGGR